MGGDTPSPSMSIAYFQDGWLLDWLKQALTPGVALALVAIVIGTWMAAGFYMRFKRMEASMLTKEDLHEAIQEMERKLVSWADGRFLTKEIAAIRDVEADKARARQNRDISYLIDRDRAANSYRVANPDPIA